MTAIVVIPTKSQEQQFLCLFPPVAELVRPSLLQFKLKSQLSRQSHLVPPTPLSLCSAINEPVIHWCTSKIEDNLYMEMCEVEVQVLDPTAKSNMVRRYYIEAAKYALRISAGNFERQNAKYKPVFEIHYNDFTPRLRAELKSLLKSSPSTLASIVENAVFCIFKARHKLIFYDYIENERLKWRFTSAN
jgi:hypothetical protein